jgi:hypothetical protein
MNLPNRNCIEWSSLLTAGIDLCQPADIGVPMRFMVISKSQRVVNVGLSRRMPAVRYKIANSVLRRSVTSMLPG